MSRKSITLVLALAALAATTTASATIVTVTLTGADENINDTSGVFGPAGGRVTGQAFTQIFTIDTKGGNVLSTPTAVSFNSIFGTTGPYAVGSSLTIGGHSFSTVGNNYSAVFIAGDYQLLSDDLPGSANLITSVDLHGPGLPTTVTQPISFAVNGTSPITALESFIDYLPGTANAQGTLSPTNVTITTAAAVPETSLGMLGLGALALAIRARRSSAR